VTRPRSGRRLTLSAPQARPRTRDPAEAQRRYRHGERAPAPGAPVLIWSEARNGLPPFRPYVYRGGQPDDGRML
jgi:hypothetical protein